jgi:hypothetical protein
LGGYKQIVFGAHGRGGVNGDAFVDKGKRGNVQTLPDLYR